MQTLTTNQSLNNLKQGLDIATKKGAFDNLETVATLLQSLNVIAQELQKKEEPEEKKK
jgi:hypothetical protein